MKNKILMMILITGFASNMIELQAAPKAKQAVHSPILEDEDDMDLEMMEMETLIKPKKQSVIQKGMNQIVEWAVSLYAKWCLTKWTVSKKYKTEAEKIKK